MEKMIPKGYEQYPLSAEQKHVWTQSIMRRGSAWTQMIYKRFTGQLDTHVLLTILEKFIEIQPQLKSNFVLKWPSIVQIIPVSNNPMRYFQEYDLSKTDNQEQSLHDLLLSLHGLKFKIEEDPLYKLIHIKMNAEESVLVQVFHHLIFDASCLHLFWDQLREIDMGKIPWVTPYTLYTEENTGITSLVDRIFWRDYFSGYKDKSVFQKNQGNSNDMLMIEIQLEPGLIPRINKFAFQRKVSPLAVYMTALFVFINKLSGAHDICLGTFFSGRNKLKYKNTIGLFMKLLPLRYTISSSVRFDEMVMQVHHHITEIYQHQNFPLSSIIEELGIPHNMRKTPLFSVVFNRIVSHGKEGIYTLRSIQEKTEDNPVETKDYSAYSSFHLGFLLSESLHESYLTLLYHQSDYSHSDAAILLENYLGLLKRFLENSSLPALAGNIWGD